MDLLRDVKVSDPPASQFLYPSPLGINAASTPALRAEHTGQDLQKVEAPAGGAPLLLEPGPIPITTFSPPTPTPSQPQPTANLIPQPQPTTKHLLTASLVAAPETLDQNIPMWDEYNEMADAHDKEFVKAANEDLNTLLIFAGLFAAINAAFIIETFKSLKADPQDTANDLLRTLIHLQNSTYPHPGDSGFNSTRRDIRTNLAFFFSLSTSLAGSFLAVMGKQWLAHYEHEEGLKSPAERARARQLKFEGRKQYYLRGVMESLPTILQVSLFVFLAGLCDLLWPLDKSVASCVMATTLLIFSLWAILTVVAALLPNFPYQTRLSVILFIALSRYNKKVGQSKMAPQNPLAVNMRIIIQMLKHITFTDTKRLNILADSFAAMPSDGRIKSVAEVMVRCHLEPLQVTREVRWDPPQLRKEFQALGIMRIVRSLLVNQSVLNGMERGNLLGNVWLAAQQTTVKSDVAEVIADIIALMAAQVEKLRLKLLVSIPKPILCQNMRHALASRLCKEAIRGDIVEDVRAAVINLFFNCLPQKYSDDGYFTLLLDNLAGFFERLPPNHPAIGVLATSMMSFCFEGQLAGDREHMQELIDKALSLNKEASLPLEHYLSVPMLRMIGVLFKSPPKVLQPAARVDILSFLWQQFWLSSMKPERAGVMAEILAFCATDVETMRQGSALRWEVECDPNRRLPLSILLTSRLFSRLATAEQYDKNSRASCLRLLDVYLPCQPQDVPNVFQNLLQVIRNPRQSDEQNTQTYLACLRVSLADTASPALNTVEKSARLSVLLHEIQYHLSCLYGILDSHLTQTSHTSLSVSALSVFMTLWHHRNSLAYPSLLESSLAGFNHPLWLSILRKWLRQDPDLLGLNYFVPWQKEEWPEPIHKLAWKEGFSMMDDISHYLFEAFSNADAYGLTETDMEEIRDDYEDWSEWLDKSVMAWLKIGRTPILRLESRMEADGEGDAKKEEGPIDVKGSGSKVSSVESAPNKVDNTGGEHYGNGDATEPSATAPSNLPDASNHRQHSGNEHYPAQHAAISVIPEKAHSDPKPSSKAPPNSKPAETEVQRAISVPASPTPQLSAGSNQKGDSRRGPVLSPTTKASHSSPRGEKPCSRGTRGRDSPSHETDTLGASTAPHPPDAAQLATSERQIPKTSGPEVNKPTASKNLPLPLRNPPSDNTGD